MAARHSTWRSCLRLVLLCGLAAAGLPGAGRAQTAPRHSFVAIDDGTESLLLIDENNPARNWSTPIGPASDLQLIGNNRLLVCGDDDFREYDLNTGKLLKTVSAVNGRTHSALRLDDGRTIVGGSGLSGRDFPGLLYFDASDHIENLVLFAKLPRLRHVRLGSESTLCLAMVGRLVETNLEGSVLRETPIPGNVFKAVKLASGDWLYSAGTGERCLRQITADGKPVRELRGGPELKEGAFLGFQILANGNVMLANWLGHGPNHDGIVLVEYDAAGKLVWSLRRKRASFIAAIVLDGLDLGLCHYELGGRLVPRPPAPRSR